jgi:RimJ/RimL family protein N-acetyltransferase
MAFHRESNAAIGGGGFKGEPGPDGIVEIAYWINEEFRGLGYATEVAEAIVAFAFADPRVRLVCAHTLPDAMASPRVLEKCGFMRVPDLVDPDDGLVRRFERVR